MASLSWLVIVHCVFLCHRLCPAGPWICIVSQGLHCKCGETGGALHMGKPGVLPIKVQHCHVLQQGQKNEALALWGLLWPVVVEPTFNVGPGQVELSADLLELTPKGCQEL